MVVRVRSFAGEVMAISEATLRWLSFVFGFYPAIVEVKDFTCY
jgi:hypothetical protein